MRILCYFFIVTEFSKDEEFILVHGFRGFFPWSWPWPHCCEPVARRAMLLTCDGRPER